ncbi:MAG: hypothetical protein NT031_19800 [Planctomycetota bacterium]|nr:hypothetical protein [Planctomycetota bacterium]
MSDNRNEMVAGAIALLGLLGTAIGGGFLCWACLDNRQPLAAAVSLIAPAICFSALMMAVSRR